MGGDAVAHVHALGPGSACRRRWPRSGSPRRTCAAMAERPSGIKRLIDNNPRPLDADALEAILDAAWHGERPPARRGRVSP